MTAARWNARTAALLALAYGVASGSAACGGSPTAVTPAVTVSAVTVTGSAPAVGAAAQFTATATLTNGTTQGATSQATWSSSNPAVATVNGAGLVTGIAAGEADISATFQSIAGRAHITIANTSPIVFTLSGTVTDGTSSGTLPNITLQAVDSVGNSKSAVSNAAGAFSIAGLAPGVATLTASAISYQATRLTVSILGDTRADVVLSRVTCAFSVAPTSAAFSSSGGTATVTVATTATGCAWQARSNDAFIALGSSGGIDSGSVTYTVAPNGGAARTGTLTIAGATVAIQQEAALVLQMAQYDSTLKAPLCNAIGSGCDSGTLLSGSGSTEPNQPNTIFNSCADGAGVGHYGAIPFVRVSTLDGSALAPGKTIRIDIGAGGSTANSTMVSVADDALHPVWTQIGGILHSAGPFSVEMVLPSGSLEAIRVNRAFGSGFGPGPCTVGSDDDTDDLVFRVR
jgi:hypothetical protein